MKYKYLVVLLLSSTIFSCTKIIDVKPQSNLSVLTYYSNLAEMNAALAGCYNGMQAPLITEWEFTELRSDNAKQGNPGTSSASNSLLNDLDMFVPAPGNTDIEKYWFATYNNIRNCNTLLEKLGVIYDPATATFTYNPISAGISDADVKQVAGQAMMIRAYHYFNLVRLFGGVFLVNKTLTLAESKSLQRSTVAEMYKFIEADLRTATTSIKSQTYGQQAATDRGRVTVWAAKSMLAKVLLTQNKKSEAIPILQDVIANSGHNVLASYSSVFSISNEMNSEIVFAVRFKAGSLGLGSPFGNDFGPLNSANNVISGSGDGFNTPTTEIDTLTNGDLRKPTIIGVYTSGTLVRIYVKKYLNPVITKDDGESDWPVIRFPDVQMMLAEAQGYSQASLDLINAVRPRAGEPLLTLTTVPNVAAFEKALSRERRLEFAFENQRWFDIVRFGTTLTTLNAIDIMKAHFAYEYLAHYFTYPAPRATIPELQANVTPDRLLLPIPQKEIDTNTQMVIPQNPGY